MNHRLICHGYMRDVRPRQLIVIRTKETITNKEKTNHSQVFDDTELVATTLRPSDSLQTLERRWIGVGLVT